MKKVILLTVAVLTVSSLGFSKEPDRKTANSQTEVVNFIDSRREALNTVLQELAPDSLKKISSRLGLKGQSTEEIMSFVAPEGESANYTSILLAESAIVDVLKNVKGVPVSKKLCAPRTITCAQGLRAVSNESGCYSCK